LSGTARRLSLLSFFSAALILAIPLSSSAPAELSSPPVSAGGAHTCAIDADGELACWGDDSSGQVSEAPGGQFLSLSAGGAHTCAIAADGTLACWGDDAATEPDQIPSGEFQSVSAGGAHTCAIDADNELSCWGDDSSDQLDGIPSDEFRSVSAGGAHTCAIRADGALLCWGDDSSGQVSEAPDSIDDHEYSGVGAGHENHEHQFLTVSSGGAHACAIDPEGKLVCWGDDSSGQLDDVPRGEFRSVSAGGAHTCAIRTNGALACWGDDSLGQLDEIPSGGFRSVSAGGAHTCAIRADGTLFCWGDNGHGQSHPLLAQEDLPRAVIGSPYSFVFEATPQSPEPDVHVSSGSLPPGLNLSGDGELSGTPTSAGDFAFTVTTTNDLAGDASQDASIEVVGTPEVGTDAAQAVTSSTAILTARINPRNLPAQTWFEYWPAAAPQSATHTPANMVAASVGPHGLSAQIAGLTPETQYAFRVAATNELAPNGVYGSVGALKTAPGPGLPPPVAGVSVNVDTANGVVRVKCKGDRDFAALKSPKQIPVGCELDTDGGTVALTASRGSSGATQSAYFWGGTFEIDQNPGDEQDAVATLGGRLRCEKRGGAKGATASRDYLRGRGGGRKLWGSGSGNFKTVGNYGSASVRGTTWLVIDRCDLSSVFEVKEGRVKIRDFVKGISLIIAPGKRYVAKAPFLRLR
jgi:Regulator of chromosome condensation (RCC1) repeat/Putative Ig domain